jgi:hypothetical protein
MKIVFQRKLVLNLNLKFILNTPFGSKTRRLSVRNAVCGLVLVYGALDVSCYGVLELFWIGDVDYVFRKFVPLKDSEWEKGFVEKVAFAS